MSNIIKLISVFLWGLGSGVIMWIIASRVKSKKTAYALSILSGIIFSYFAYILMEVER